MRSAIPVEQLEVIGYADSLDESMLPSIVPPVFAFRSDSARALVPPYGFNAGILCGATEIGRAELQGLRDSGEIVLFENSFPARLDFELWIDKSGRSQYESRVSVQQKLQDFARQSVREAREAFDAGQMDEADRRCSAAISANDRFVPAFALKAAIRRWENDSEGEQLMARLVERFIDSESFAEMVDRLSPSNRRPRPASHRAPASLMQRMALERR